MQNSYAERLTRWRGIAYAAWAIIGIALVILGIGWGISRISGALAPFVIAFIFVFVFQAPVRFLERRGLKRPLAVAICFLTSFLVIGVSLVYLVPSIGRQLVAFAEAMPGYLESGKVWATELLQKSVKSATWSWVSSVWDQVSKSVGAIFMNLGKVVAERLLSVGSGVATVIVDVVMGAVVAFWVLKDLPKMRDELRTLAGDDYEDDLENLVSTVGRVVGGYLRGQFVNSATTGVLAGIGLALINVKYALVLGILAFVMNFVPYVGPLITAAIAAIVGLFTSPLAAGLAILVCVASQQITDLFVSPRVMAEQVDLHPVLVIFSLLVGGSLFGLWGMLFAIPVAATAKGLFVYYWERRNDRALATENGALFRTVSEGEAADELVDKSEVE